MPKKRFKTSQEVSQRHFNRLLREESNVQHRPQSNNSYEIPLKNDHHSNTNEDNNLALNETPFTTNEIENNTLNITCDSFEIETDSVSSENVCGNEQQYEPNCTSDNTDDNTNCSSEYIAKLSKWAVSFKINHNALNSLLNIQRNEKGYSSLPKDSRTLLQTPRKTVLRNVSPGQYHHFSLTFALSSFLESLGKSKPKEIEIFVGIDGLPISKSSSSQVWPILCTFKSNLNKTSPVYPIGIYHGQEKPTCSNDFLKDFIDEAVDLVSHGFKENSHLVIPVKIGAIVCDAPAKSFVFKTKGHTGFFSCSRCTLKGKSKDNRVYFPDTDCPSRTHFSFFNNLQNEYHTGVTDLTKLPNFDLVKCVPLDYMHLVCLGVVKKLLTMWLFVKKGNNRLSNYEIQLISDKLSDLRNYIPSEFSRKPRSLSEAGRWKATELRQFLLYSGPVVLKYVLNERLYLNFLSLSVGVSIMLSHTYHRTLLDYADALLKYFVSSFSTIYGKQYVSHNVHGLIHLKEDVLQFGPLDSCSAFGFENYMSSIKKLVARKPDKPLQQFARRYSEIMSHTTVNDDENEVKQHNVKNSHHKGPTLPDCPGDEFTVLEIGGIYFRTHSGDNCCKLLDGTIVVIDNIVKNDSTVHIIGKRFRKLNDFFVKPCPSSKVDIYFCDNLGSLRSWKSEDILMKCVKLPFSGGFVIYPFLHGSVVK